MSQSELLSRVKDWIDLTVIKRDNYRGHDADLVTNHITIISASLDPVARVISRFTVAETMLNAGGNMHGGAIATIFDNCSSLPLILISKEGFWEWSGLSRSLNVVYLAAVREGELIEVEAEVVKVTKRLGRQNS